MKHLIHLLMKLGLSGYLARQLSKPQGVFGSRFIGRMMNRSNAHLEALAFELLAPQATDRILEVGFGNGQLTEQLCRTSTSGMVHGIDISDDMVEQTSDRLRPYIQSGKAKLERAAVSRIPLTDGSMDKAVTCNTVYFWPDPMADARELLRVLREGGTFVCGFRVAADMERFGFVVENRTIFKNAYTAEQMEQLLLAAGFRTATVHMRSDGLADSYVAVAVK